MLQQHHGVQSMSRRGNCWDNAIAESFFASFKKERVRGKTVDSVNHARRVVQPYIDGFYHPRRRHSNNDGLSPFDFEHNYTKQNMAACAA